MIIDDTKLLGAVRSNGWGKIRTEHLEKYPRCACCGGIKKLEVHHKVPFHIDPTKELDLDNLITLCENKKQGLNCHLCIGHVGLYKSYNIDVAKDAEYFNNKFNNRPI